MNYLNRFLNLQCSLDVLKLYKHPNGLGNISKDFVKEISESMSVIQEIKDVAFKHDKIFLIDLCAGNALTSVIACHLFKNLQAVAIDLKSRKEDFLNVKNFQYLNLDIHKFDLEIIPKDSYVIVIGVHACKNLAIEICKIYNNINNQYNSSLILMPCCIGKYDKLKEYPTLLTNKLSNYELWCLWVFDYLKRITSNNCNIKTDLKILSPCNILITSLQE